LALETLLDLPALMDPSRIGHFVIKISRTMAARLAKRLGVEDTLLYPSRATLNFATMLVKQ